MTRQYRVKENEGSRTPPLYSPSRVVHRLFVSWQPLCVAIDSVVLAETRCRPCLLLVFTPCAPLSTCLLPLVLFVLLVLPLPVVPDLYLVCACSSSRVCDASCVCCCSRHERLWTSTPLVLSPVNPQDTQRRMPRLAGKGRQGTGRTAYRDEDTNRRKT